MGPNALACLSTHSLGAAGATYLEERRGWNVDASIGAKMASCRAACLSIVPHVSLALFKSLFRHWARLPKTERSRCVYATVTITGCLARK